MNRLKDNLLVQFSLFNLIIMVVLAAVIVLVLDSRLDGAYDLLSDHEHAMASGIIIKESEPFSIPNLSRSVRALQWITIGIVTGAFVVLYIGLVFIVRRGWRTINEQRSILNATNVELALLAEVGRIITSSPDITDVYQRFAARVREYVPFDQIAVALLDDEGDSSLIVYALGIDVPERPNGGRVPLKGTLTEAVTSARSSMLIEADDMEELVRRIPGIAPGLNAGLRSFLAVPLIAGDEIIGVLHVRSTKTNAYTERELGVIEQVGRQIAPAMENARLYGQLKDGQERLRSLSNKLVEVQEVERQQLARELHDEVGQILTGLKLALEITPKLPAFEAKSKMEEATSLINDLQGRVRELSLNLRPAMLDDLGLLPTLLWHYERFTGLTQVKVDFEHSGIDRRFPAEVELTAYRIVQEALTNAARHADVDALAVKVQADDAVLSLDVSDEGVGFDTAVTLRSKDSNGLSGIRERIELLGGLFTLDSAPGIGTQLIAELPLNGENGKV